MQTVSIRNLRGAHLRKNALKRMPLGITNGGVLIAVLVPMEAAWVEHLIDHNWSKVRQSIVEGERSLPTALAAVTLDDMIAEGDASYGEQAASDLSVRTVRIGDLTGRLIEQAGAEAQFLAITHDRELTGIIIPVTWSLVNFLIEQNLARILYNIGLSEKHVKSLDKMITLDDTFYRADQLIDHVERITVSAHEEEDRLLESQQPARDSPQTVVADREVAGKQEADAELPKLAQELPESPHYQAGRRDLTTTADRPMKTDTGIVFLCHSSSDKPSVRLLRGRLLDDRIQSWFDEEDILPGQDWDLAIRKAIRTSDIVLVCLSRASVSKVGYLQKEIKHVLDVADEQPEESIFLIPVRLEPCDVPERLRKYQWVDLFEERGYPRLLRALRSRESD